VSISIDWNNLRPLDGSQRTAFEELCCQLAAYEKLPHGSKFVRKGVPDAGVECYWVLPGSNELAWQAKYFTSTPGDNQWRQLDDSAKTALAKHPHITSYTICLPLDREDPRIEKQQWFMDKWVEHVEKWQQWAAVDGKFVEFNYWGQHEILDRLSREEHSGRNLFWFNKELFSQNWFKHRLQETIANVGPRYTPELNIDLPIAHLFDGLGRSQEFYDRLIELYNQIKKNVAKIKPKEQLPAITGKLEALDNHVKSLLLSLEKAFDSGVDVIDWGDITGLTGSSWQLVWDCVTIFEEAAKAEKAMSENNRQSEEYARNLEYDSYNLRNFSISLREVQEFAESSEALAGNISALLITGKAGQGKTHLLCDVAKKRLDKNRPTILLLGNHFNDGEPWAQIIQELGLSCYRDEFLGALEAAGSANNSKTLILIDAVNEGPGNQLWSKFLAGMITTLSRYQWIGLALTVRSSYEDVIIPEGLVPQQLVREVHHGFTDHEYQASQVFFDHYGIERPTVPLLVPEFQNPLFLKLFCISLNNRNLTIIPSGLQGISAVFNFFLESVNEKLADPGALDFDKKSSKVQMAVEKVVEVMAEKNVRWLGRDEAAQIVNVILPPKSYGNSLFKHMIDEGILSEDRFWKGEGEWEEGISCSYERFSDHLIVKHLLNKYLNHGNPSESFAPAARLGSLIKDEQTSWQNRGLIEALSVQLPELIGEELGELAPGAAEYRPVREAFIDSLIWRDPKAITKATRQHINEHIIKYSDSHDHFLDALLTITQNPEHPYNARFLHRHLMKFELADRDAWWSVFLHNQYDQHTSVDRLVEWAGSDEDKTHISDEPIMLCGMALSWFLTTSNRFLRDKSTKALVSLFTPRLHLLTSLLQEFREVDDPYVLERLVAISYGCSTRSEDNENIAELADYIYKWQFEDGRPMPHILLRDYARGVVELALKRSIRLDIDWGKIKPPYQSEWPTNIPSPEYPETVYGKFYKDMPKEEFASLDIYHSVMDDDFSRYIISGLDEWSSQRLGEPDKPTKKEIYETFLKSLTERQKKKVEFYRAIVSNTEFYKRLDEARREELFGRQFTEEELQSSLTETKDSALATLGKKKAQIFNTHVIPYLANPHEDERRFDGSEARRLILQKVLDLGWTKEKFGIFDRDIAWRDRGRSAHTPERIGKKYQWIAYHELLARISDNFYFRGRSWTNENEREYDGPWQLTYIRDIDPSSLLRNSRAEHLAPNSATWWFTPTYDDWESEPNNATWLKNQKDLPGIHELIQV